MMRILLGAAMLAACTPVVETRATYRDGSVPITSVALFDPAQFAGHWDVIATYGGGACGLDVGVVTAGVLDLASRGCSGDISQSVAQVSGPGRYTPKDGVSKDVEHWVMWVDQTYRTAVIGTVGGEFGMILNRGRDIPADRMAVAREILDWNGYDPVRLKMRP
ncbi:MAG: lipocalin family protein [Marinosulfonomonas sp.]|nr:lipocalin family protein [Marinosulfonomonas sp.]